MILLAFRPPFLFSSLKQQNEEGMRIGGLSFNFPGGGWKGLFLVFFWDFFSEGFFYLAIFNIKSFLSNS